MKIKQLSDSLGIPCETIRYYEKIGLMPKPKRTANGYRLYDDESLILLKFIKKCRSLGFCLDDIRQLIALKNTPEKHHDADTLVMTHIATIEQQQQALHEMKIFLQSLLTYDNHDSHDCQVMTGLLQS